MFEQTSKIELGFGMQLAKSSTLNECQASLVNVHIYESINDLSECVGYHIAVCVAVDDSIDFIKQKKAELLLNRPPHMQCRSFLLHLIPRSVYIISI